MGIKKLNRVGEMNISNQGCEMIIVEYDGALDIVIEFQDKYKARVYSQYSNFKKGEIKNPYFPNVYNIGMIGEKYSGSYINKNGKITSNKEYKLWHHMIRRCYDKKTQLTRPTYIGCSVSDEWLLFDNFYEWLVSQSNYEKWKLGNYQLDKDIINKNNKIYSKENCYLVPQNINKLFTTSKKTRGDLPIGVSSSKKEYRASCENNTKTISLGHYPTPEEAFYIYKEYKENLIKQIADKYYQLGEINKECYSSMINWTIEITD